MTGVTSYLARPGYTKYDRNATGMTGMKYSLAALEVDGEAVRQVHAPGVGNGRVPKPRGPSG